MVMKGAVMSQKKRARKRSWMRMKSKVIWRNKIVEKGQMYRRILKAMKTDDNNF